MDLTTDDATWPPPIRPTWSAAEQPLDYWRRMLSGGLPVLQLPTDRPHLAFSDGSCSIEAFTVSEQLTEELRTLSRREGVALPIVLLAALNALLHRYSGQDDIMVAIARQTGLKLGNSTNLVALRTQLSGDLSFRDLLLKTRDAVTEALNVGEVPLDRIIREIAPQCRLRADPLFRVIFSFRSRRLDFATDKQLRKRGFNGGGCFNGGGSQPDLFLQVHEKIKSLGARFIYRKEFFTAATVRRTIGHWTTVLEGIVADPDCALGQLPLMTAEELRRSLVEWNATRQEVPHIGLLPMVRIANSPIAAGDRSDLQ